METEDVAHEARGEGGALIRTPVDCAGDDMGLGPEP